MLFQHQHPSWELLTDGIAGVFFTAVPEASTIDRGRIAAAAIWGEHAADFAQKANRVIAAQIVCKNSSGRSQDWPDFF